MHNLQDQKFGKLFVVGKSREKGPHGYLWECRCDCGKTTLSSTQPLMNGHKKSCGCLSRKDFSGTRFNRLVVRRQHGTDKHQQRLWMCDCDCGGKAIKATIDLTSGKVGSCGCIQKDIGNKSRFWKGHGEISGSFWNRVTKGAKSRSIDFSVNIEECWSLFLAQDKKCALTGIPLKFRESLKTGTCEESTASLDRIDSKKGYVIGNIQWVHKDVNYMKQDLDQQYFISMCQRIVENNVRKNKEQIA